MMETYACLPHIDKMYVCVCVYVNVHMGAQRSHKRVSNTLELGLHAGAAVTHLMSWELNLCKCNVHSDLGRNL